MGEPKAVQSPNPKVRTKRVRNSKGADSADAALIFKACKKFKGSGDGTLCAFVERPSPTANPTSLKFLPLLFDDDELSSLSEDDSKDECVDNESGGIASDCSEEGTQVSEKELEDEEQGEAASVPRDATLAPLVWTDRHYFEPNIHNFDNGRLGVTDD